jgi:hypothetical protein
MHREGLKNLKKNKQSSNYAKNMNKKAEFKKAVFNKSCPLVRSVGITMPGSSLLLADRMRY